MIKMNTITVDIAFYGNVGLWLLLCVDLYWIVRFDWSIDSIDQ